MKKIIYTLTLLIIPLMVSANSSCSIEEQSELKTEANLIKVDYEIIETVLDPSEYSMPDYYEGDPDDFELKSSDVKINIINLTENLYIEVTNDYNNTVEIIKYEDSNSGHYTMDDINKYEIVTYTFTVKASSNTSCESESMKLIYITKPKYNFLSEKSDCMIHTESSSCEKFTTNDNLDVDSFLSEMEELDKDKFNDTTNDEEQTEGENTGNLNLVLIVGIIILVVAITFAIIKRARRKNEI